MKIIVVGCGKIGATIVGGLLNEGHDVTVVDSSAEVITDTTNIYDVRCVCGSGTDYEVLADAGADTADLIIAITGSDEFNMLSCFIAKRMGTEHSIARIRNPEYNDASLGFLKNELGLSRAINPELMVAKELSNMLKLPSAAKVETFSHGKFEMIELNLKDDSLLDGISLIDLRKKYTEKFLVCAVERDGTVYIPDGNFILKSGDKIGILASTTEIQRLLKKLGLMKKQARNVMILGATHTSYYLAKMLLASGNTVKIIDSDITRCKAFADDLHDAVIINGDGAREELLIEEGIKNVDAFVTLTGHDEQNILVSYFAQMQNVPKVITKVTRSEYTETADKLGLESLASPRKTIHDILLRYVMALENSQGSVVETLYKIMDDKAEALEFKVEEDCDIIGIPLKTLKTKDNILVAGIVRGRQNIIPSGDDTVEAGDYVIILSAGHKVQTLSDIVKR